MKRYLIVLLALVSCCAFAIAGYAVGAYMQFLYTFSAKQDALVRDIATARGLTNNQVSETLEWVRKDAPLQYEFLSDYEKIRNASLPVKLSSVARMTWTLRAWPSEGIRTSERWRQMMSNCQCGLAPIDLKTPEPTTP